MTFGKKELKGTKEREVFHPNRRTVCRDSSPTFPHRNLPRMQKKVMPETNGTLPENKKIRLEIARNTLRELEEEEAEEKYAHGTGRLRRGF